MTDGPTIGDVSVGEAMHPGLVSCGAETPLRVVVRMMATYRVHAIVVFPDPREKDGGWSVVSDADVLRAAVAGDVDALTAGDVAASPVAAIGPSAPLADAADLMTARGATHVVVVDPGTSRPVGVVSTLDVTRALAGFPDHARYGRGS